jgi:ADP-ribosyl-[dinitrogen reductase] hydrolase
MPLDRRARIRGCLLGGALGDALGAPVEFLSLTEIQTQFGAEGITSFAPAYGRRGAITDDTQMTLFTAEGLLRAVVRQSRQGVCDVTAVVCHSYLRWLLTQDMKPSLPLEVGRDGWLWSIDALHSQRAPGRTCVMALIGKSRFASVQARNTSKGAGGIMRIAPVAWTTNDRTETGAWQVFDLAQRVAWITHGHPSGYLAAAAFAVVLHAISLDLPLETGIARARQLVSDAPDGDEVLAAMAKAIQCATHREVAATALPSIGAGWVAEEALGIALYCALTSRTLEQGLRTAVNHSGDSDTTGSLAGQLLGAMYGDAALPSEWLRDLELRDVIEAVADDLSTLLGASGQDAGILVPHAADRYPGW